MGVLDRLRSEAASLAGLGRTLARLKPIIADPSRTYPDIAEKLAEEHGDRPALLSEEETLTFRAYNSHANRYSRWAMANGLGKGDCVALLMPNRPEYLAVWLGVARAGGVSALLNTNLTGPALAHCVNIVEPKHVIVDGALAEAFASALPHLAGGATIWCFGGGEERGWRRLEPVLDRLSDAPIRASERPALTTADGCLYIYTSGTTGLPKAAIINHYRVQAIMFAFGAAMRMTAEDRIYVCLPLYHSSGGVLAAGAALTSGGSVFIRDKCAARQFWDDIAQHDCTVFQYIGELCRYLLNCPPHPRERQHRLRLACGNGLRPDIWESFQSRFAIPQILEWYASTEGNAVLFNFDGKVGAVGRIPKWLERKFAIRIVRFDVGREEPVRGPDGFCVECPPGEMGEVISQIVDDPRRPSQRFDGYADKAATERKVLSGAFAAGDRWFRTGDLMKRDALGYFTFIDRVGDTFRWKGENVSTSEVAEALTAFPGVKEANVYGVGIEGQDGRAGMAALVVEEDFDLDAFHEHVTRALPPYARPLFLRLQAKIDVTGTFKQRKVDLVREGFDPQGTDDPLYVRHPERGAFVLLDAALHEAVQSGRIKL